MPEDKVFGAHRVSCRWTGDLGLLFKGGIAQPRFGLPCVDIRVHGALASSASHGRSTMTGTCLIRFVCFLVLDANLSLTGLSDQGEMLEYGVIELVTTSSHVRVSARRSTIVSSFRLLVTVSFMIRDNPLDYEYVITCIYEFLAMYLSTRSCALAPQLLTLCARQVVHLFSQY
jgi:hypothetical protein